MLNLYNDTSWQANVVENWQQDKQKCLTLVVKQSFEYDDQGKVFAMQDAPEIVVADDMLDEPTTSSLVAANETMPFKQGFEWYGNLTAYPPKGQQVKVIEVNVALQQGDAIASSKTLRVTGQRVWKSSLLGTKASQPSPLLPTALNYEHTYGGVDAHKPDKLYEHNPAGVGYRVKHTKGAPLPLVEYPAQTLSHPKSRIPPASYGPVPQFWQPRLSRVPQIDQQALMASQYPYKSALDPQMYNYAPQDQQLDIAFDDNVQLLLKGVSPNKDYLDVTRISLPFLPPRVAIGVDEHAEQIQLALVCDTLVLDTDANAFHLLWRKSIDINSVSPLHYVLVTASAIAKSSQAATAGGS